VGKGPVSTEVHAVSTNQLNRADAEFESALTRLYDECERLAELRLMLIGRRRPMSEDEYRKAQRHLSRLAESSANLRSATAKLRISDTANTLPPEMLDLLDAVEPQLDEVDGIVRECTQLLHAIPAVQLRLLHAQHAGTAATSVQVKLWESRAGLDAADWE
jgi:hypothetical protein